MTPSAPARFFYFQLGTADTFAPKFLLKAFPEKFLVVCCHIRLIEGFEIARQKRRWLYRFLVFWIALLPFADLQLSQLQPRIGVSFRFAMSKKISGF